ncbi:glutathione S-transferase-like [Humulus lupulus]|uniref:glutathione S-transferase-like n=1 Tax=Humulus lupulus TaxID=3486 RepID=UPI002B40EB35|nr:glutathione S-transferase-like [Humulus lupulus]
MVVGVKVIGTAYSIATMRVMACLYEKDLDFELVPVNLSTGEHKREPFVSLNPFGQVPAFEDGDLKLYESRAITRYIAQEYINRGTDLVFKEPKKQAVESVWAEVEAHHFDPAGIILNWELSVKPRLLGQEVDQAAVDENEDKLVQVLDVYEKRLTESKYLGGDRYTLADLHHLPTAEYLMDTGVKMLFESRPRVSAWLADITARPAWGKVVALRNQALKKRVESAQEGSQNK